MSDVCLIIWGQTSFSRLLITLWRCQHDWCQCAVERYSCKNLHALCGLTFVAFVLLLYIMLRISDHFLPLVCFIWCRLWYFCITFLPGCVDLYLPILMGSGNMLHFFLFIGIDDGADIDRDILVGIYERVKANEFKPGSDHVTQVMKVQSTIVGKKPVSNFVWNYRCLTVWQLGSIRAL